MSIQPSPPPRRRRPQQPLVSPHPVVLPRSDDQPPSQPRPAETGTAAHRLRRAHSHPLARFLHRMPRGMRPAAAALFSVLLLLVLAFVTRSYLESERERRRLEAEAAERARHPLYFEEQIRYYAQLQSLDPALVASIILCESSFDPQAESRLGARGLMQLMEPTAEWVAHKLDEDDASYSFDRLYDVDTNIRFGTWYLGYLSRRFDGDPTKIVCAYHAGQGNVDSWLRNSAYSSDGVTLDVIPTQDTAAYADRVLRALLVYRKYYFPIPSADPSALPDSSPADKE